MTNRSLTVAAQQQPRVSVIGNPIAIACAVHPTMAGACTTITPQGGRSTLWRWFLIIGAFGTIAAGIAAIVIWRNWPFTREAVNKALQDRFARTVVIRNFHNTYFPPGGVAEEVSFQHRIRKDLPPLITVRKLIIQGSYAGLLGAQKRVPQIQVIGLHILVPPKSRDGHSHSIMPLTDSKSKKSLRIGEIKTNNAVLEFRSNQPGKEPFKLEIHQLILDHVGESGPISFHASLLNTEPPGEIRSDGQFGPWDADDPGSTPVSGSYTFADSKLGVFGGVSGTLSSKGKFSGTLDHIDCDGTADVPNFHVSSSNHIVHLSTEFHAEVDAANGDTYLQTVQSHFQRTTVVSKGGVTGHAGQKGKTTALEMSVKNGRVEDLLRLFANQPRPSMSGEISLRAKVEVPPGPPGFLRKLNLEGDFGIGGGRFTNPAVQRPVNILSESARGESKKQEAEDPETMFSNLKGHVVVKDGIATLSNISGTIPGAFAEMRGIYNLVDKTVDMKGVLHTTGKLSDTTSGFKALVLKTAGPFLKRKSVTVVPFTIKGAAAHPLFALDFGGKRHL